ncbi:MAG: archaeosortase/exosortase family protein [Planctomycetota bacterium]|jgi:exosortase/archaeosortase family protein
MNPNRLILAVNLILLLPYLRLLSSLWATGSKDAAASGLAVAGGLVFGVPILRNASARPATQPALGFCGFILAAFLYVSAVLIDFRVLVGVSATGMLAAQCYLTYGSAVLRRLSVPFLLLLMATPVPAFILSGITRELLDLSVVLMPALLEPFLGPITVEGYHLFFGEPGAVRGIEIVEDCSGLGGILLFVPLAVIFLYAHGKVSILAGSSLVLLSPVLGYLGSLFRIYVTGLFVSTDSDFLRSDGMHSVLGIVSLLLTGLVLLLLCRLFAKRS